MISKATMGAEGIQSLMKDLDMDQEIAIIREEIPATRSETKIKKLSKRLETFRGLSWFWK
jgi:DNA-directed RNA polymerase subunit beta'